MFLWADPRPRQLRPRPKAPPRKKKTLGKNAPPPYVGPTVYKIIYIFLMVVHLKKKKKIAMLKIPQILL